MRDSTTIPFSTHIVKTFDIFFFKSYTSILFNAFFKTIILKFIPAVSLSNIQQVIERFTESNEPLVTLTSNPSVDAVTSALSLAAIAAKLEKRANIISVGFAPNKEISFIKELNNIQATSEHLRKFLITVNTEHAALANLSYEVKDKKVEIYLTPKKGFWQPEDVRMGHGGWKNDLAIVLDARDLESLGELFEHHAEFFYNTPIINIDHHPDNENFGQINLVDIKATSICEILFNFINEWNRELIDEDMATLLLTGIVSKTQSFKKASTPQTLSIASQLIALGADRSTIVNNLYQQKPLTLLKLWGRVLARLKNDPNLNLVWSIIPRADFEKSGGAPQDIPSIIDELIANSPQAGIVIIIYETPEGKIEGIARLLHNHHNMIEALAMYSPDGDAESITFALPTETRLAQVEELVIKRVRDYINAQQT